VPSPDWPPPGVVEALIVEGIRARAAVDRPATLARPRTRRASAFAPPVRFSTFTNVETISPLMVPWLGPGDVPGLVVPGPVSPRVSLPAPPSKSSVVTRLNGIAGPR